MISLASIGSEAWRNLCTGTTRALGFALALASGLGMLGWAEIATAGDASRKVADFVAAGASTYTLTSERNIDGATCEGLADSGYVDVAGALRETDSVRLEVIRSTPVAMYEYTPRLVDLLVPNNVTSSKVGVHLSPALAEVVAPGLGSSTGDSNSGSRSLYPVDAIGVYNWPDDGRPTSLQYAIVGETPPVGVFDQCWIRASDPTRDPSFLLRSVLRRGAGAGVEAELAQLNPTLGTTLSAQSDFASRPTRHAWLAALFLGSLLGAASLWLRRLEVANARDLGLAPGAQQMQTALEAMTWALAGLALTAPALAFRVSQELTDQADLILVAAPILLAGWVGVLTGAGGMAARIRRKPTGDYLRTR